MSCSTRPEPLIPPGQALVALEGGDARLSALKPNEAGTGIVLRLLNERAAAQEVVLQTGFPFAAARRVRLDEQPWPEDGLQVDGDRIRLRIAPYGIAGIHVQNVREPARGAGGEDRPH